MPVSSTSLIFSLDEIAEGNYNVNTAAMCDFNEGVMMATTVKTRIIKIGNSQGIRIPKLLLDQSGLGEEVELELDQNRIVIRPAHRARYNWEEQFSVMAERKDDKVLDGDQALPTAWDEDEWEW
jgi:antitoxin MazE